MRTKYAVYGWIREAERELNINKCTIPEILNSICILYLPEEDSFQIIQKNMDVSENKRIIWKYTSDNEWNCNYGKFIIPSLSDGVCQWDLRINKLDIGTSVFLGVSSNINRTHSKDDNNYLLHDAGYKNEINSREWVRYCPRLTTNDSISVKLDLIKAEVAYSVNGKDQGVAFNNINKGNDIDYRLCVCIQYKGTEIEIINFHRYS